MNWEQDGKAWTCQHATLEFRAFSDGGKWYWYVYNDRDLVNEGVTTTVENAKQESEDAIRRLARVLNAALQEMG